MPTLDFTKPATIIGLAASLVVTGLLIYGALYVAHKGWSKGA